MVSACAPKYTWRSLSGSSRTPVREAAVRLQQDHLLKIIPNRGYFITKISV